MENIGSVLVQNVLNPPILFFFLGMLAVFLRSDLTIPEPLPKLFSLYLLLSIGLQGGYKLSHSGFSGYILLTLVLAVFMAVLVPLYTFVILKKRLDVPNAAALAATYGSISAVTFVTAAAFLDQVGVSYGGHMVAAMALMESPAIVIGLMLARLYGGKSRENGFETTWGEILREAFLNASVFLLLGAMVVGLVTGERGWHDMEPLFGHLFKPMLAFFLLDMGLVAARQMDELRRVGGFLVAFGILVPILNAVAAILIARMAGLHEGDALLFAVLSASASYIAVPAAMRLSLPEANPSIYLTLSLAITFPWNIVVGIPMYYGIIHTLWG